MNEEQLYQKFETELTELADRYSVTRMKISTTNFDREYRRGEAGNFQLVSVKAVVRVLGKVSKIPIGDDQECKTYAEAEEYAKKYWSEYYKKVRAKRSDAEKAAEAKRQKAYRERRKARVTELKRQQ